VYQRDFEMREAGVPPPVSQLQDHQFIVTITGRCARAGCGLPQVNHPVTLSTPVDGCLVDHRSVPNWTPCPICNATVEPKMILGAGPQGELSGAGRGRLNNHPRTTPHLEFVRFMAEKIGL